MTAPRHKILPLLISALISARAGAVGFGAIELHSYLGKPLDAVIPLTHLDDLTADQLRISLGSQDDYHALGVEFTYQHTLLKIEPMIKNGRGFVHIVTRDPVAEPYLNFVLNLRWPQGQVVREYTVLLDPPAENRAVAGTSAVAPSGVVAASATAAGNQAPAANPEAVPASAIPAATTASATREAKSASIPADHYAVRPGDSLWKVAAQWRRAGVSVEQMMAAIYSANPQAFVSNDPARLKAATTLQMPSAEQIAAAQPLESGPDHVGSTAPARSVAVEAAPAPTTPEPSPAPTGTTTAAPRDDELIAENATLKREVADLTTNVGALNDNLAASQERLHDMEMKLGTLIDQLERQRITTQQLANAAGVAAPQVESMVNQATAGDLLAAPPAHTPWWVHVGYSVAIAALGAWLVFTQLWPRRRPVLVAGSAPRSLLAREEIENRLVAKVPAADTWNTPSEQENYWHHHGDVSDLPLDLVAPEAATATPRRDVPPNREAPTFADVTVTRTAEDAIDPTISAGVFSAFGRFDEAEQVLSEAMLHEPRRIDLKLQLLDVYKHEDKREAFQKLADAIALDHADDENTLHELAVLRDLYLG